MHGLSSHLGSQNSPVCLVQMSPITWTQEVATLVLVPGLGKAEESVAWAWQHCNAVNAKLVYELLVGLSEQRACKQKRKNCL